MDEIIRSQLSIIEQYAEHMAQEAIEISKSVTAIFGYCAGHESGVQYFLQQACSATSSPLNNSIICNEYQEIVSHPKTIEEIIQEVKEMIIELKIKGSVREHRDGLLKFTSTAFGCVYGRTKEEIEKQLLEKIKKQSTTKDQKDKKKDVLLLSQFYKESYLPYKKKTLTENSIEGIEV